jgi:peroxiredoxin
MMAFAARTLLGALFAIAGAGKLVHPAQTRKTLVEFGLPTRAVRFVAVLLPLVELACAGGLFVHPTARFGAGAAVALLGLFTTAVIHVLARGQRVACNCFGAFSAEKPVSRGTLLRNAALLAVAGTVVAGGAGHAPVISLTSDQRLVVIAGGSLLILLAALAFFSYELFRQNGRLLVRVEALEAGAGIAESSASSDGLPAGAYAPDFSLSSLDGQTVSLQHLLERGAPVALGFLDPDCGACGPAITQLADIRERRGGELAVAIITRGDAEAARRRINGYEFDAVLLQVDREANQAYRVRGVPAVQLIDPAGRTLAPLAIGSPAIAALLDRDPVLAIAHVSQAG